MSRMDTRGQRKDKELVLAQVALEALGGPGGSTLVVDDRGSLASLLGDGAALWSRFERDGLSGRAWPQQGPWDRVAVRLPQSVAALEMAVHAACARMRPDGVCYVYGANDEGIKSTGKKLAGWFEQVWTVQTKRKCRVMAARAPKVSWRAEPEQWSKRSPVELEGAGEWTSWPGTFAKGGLDTATSLLIDALPKRSARRVFDFACGTGVLAHVLSERGASEVYASDADHLAVRSTQANVPHAQCFASDGWAGVPQGLGVDWVVSNPPFHVGKHEDFRVFRELVQGAASRSQTLWLVTQKQIPCAPVLESSFPRVHLALETTRFHVWRSSHKL